jgi:hypothetical protein
VQPTPPAPAPAKPNAELVAILKELSDGQTRQDKHLEVIDDRIAGLEDRVAEIEVTDNDIPTPPPSPPPTRPEVRLNESEIERIAEQLRLRIPPPKEQVLWVYDDADKDGFWKDGDKFIPVTNPSGGDTGQEVFKIRAPLGEPLKIQVHGLLDASK